MANQIQESILNAIQHMVDSNVNQLAVDKTVTATIEKCTNALTGEYRVNYNGGFMFAYAQDGKTYTPNTQVYVHVPLGDFSKTKIIIGKAQKISDDNNISFISSLMNDYNLIGKNPIKQDNTLIVGLHSYLKEDYQLIYQYQDPEHSLVTIDSIALRNTIKNAEALLIETSFSTRLPKAHRLAAKGNYGISFTLAFKDRDNPEEIKYLSYQIDNNSMTGNPFLFNSWSDQSNIYNIDTENFLYIDSIIAYSKDFVDKDDIPNATLHGADILLKEFEFYGLKKITAISGDYKLTLAMPQGNTLYNTNKDNTISAVGQLIYKENSNLSDSATFYWFSEDSRITSASENYHMYGGAGWRLLNKGNNYTSTYNGDENKAYINNYMCVVVYKENIILKDYFSIYNEACKRDITITSSLGEVFSFDRGKPKLTCLVNGYESNFEQDSTDEFPHPDSLYRFVWSKTNQQGLTTIFNQTAEDAQKNIDDLIASGDFSYSTLSILKQIHQELIGVEFTPGSNTLIYPMKQVDNINTFTCEVFLRDSVNDTEDKEYSIGSASITLQNESAAKPNDYSIVIENGNQVFQYTVEGIAPNSQRLEEPIIILPLVCRFYDPAGLEINPETYSVKWVLPLENTMIQIPKDIMEMNPANEKYEWLPTEQYNIEIVESYDYFAVNNQVQAVITYQGNTYTQYSDLTFAKVGENGTNGTDIVAKISPISDIPLGETILFEVDTGSEWDSSLNDYIPYKKTKWNYGDGTFRLDLFQQNNIFSYTNNSRWGMSIAGGNTTSEISNAQSKYFTANADLNQENKNLGHVKYDDTDASTKLYRAQIVKSSVKVTVPGETGKFQEYYAFYPIPIIYYYNAAVGRKFNIKINANETLKTVLYNANGRNPLYNKNQGISLQIIQNSKEDIRPYIIYKAEGGLPAAREDNPKNPSFVLQKTKDENQVIDERNRILTIKPDNVQTEEDIANETKAIEIIKEEWDFLNFLIKDMTALEKGFYPTQLEAQKDLDTRLKSLNKKVTVPSFCILSLTDDEDTVNLVEQVQENQNKIEEVYKDTTLTAEQRAEKLDELQTNNIAFIETLDAMSALYCIDIDGTYQDMESQLYTEEQRKFTYEILNKVYIKPDEVYTGAYTNNIVHAEIYDSPNGALLAEVYIPIHFSLNTYGLQSLNAWDGNSVEINEKGNYILAPQIGAGTKNESNNTFTGILMGEAVQYDTQENGQVKPTSSIGLFGYAGGEQSIFLDAETGAAYFGLPEDKAAPENEYRNGTVSLIPNGTSHIGSWNLGTYSLYSMDDEQGRQLDTLMKPGYSGTQYKTSIPHDSSGILLTARPEPYISIKGIQLTEKCELGGVDYTKDNTAVQPHDTFELQLDPQDSSIFTLYRHTTEPLQSKNLLLKGRQSGKGWQVYNARENATGNVAGVYSISNGTNNGWILYKKIKSAAWGANRILTDDDIISIDSAESGYVIIAKQYSKEPGNTASEKVYYEYNSYLIGQPLIPNKYYTEEELKVLSKDENAAWRREAKVGIDSQGRFYTNALKESSTSLVIGGVGGFGRDPKDNVYLGASFEVGNNNTTLFKVFMDSQDAQDEKLNAPIYLMGSPTVGNSTMRPMHLYGQELSLNAGSCNGTVKEGSTRLLLDDGLIKAGTSNDYISLGRNKGSTDISKIQTQFDLSIKSRDKTELRLNSGDAKLNADSLYLNANNNITQIVSKSRTFIKGTNSFVDIYNNRAKLSCNNDESYLQLNAATNKSTLRSGGALDITAPGRILIESNPNANHNIELKAGSTTGLILNGGTATANTTFNLRSSRGSLVSANGRIYTGAANRNYIQCSNDFRVPGYCAAYNFNYLTKATSPSVVHTNGGAKTTYSYTSVWDHIKTLYELLSLAYTRANTGVSDAAKAKSAANAAQKSANKAQSTADNANSSITSLKSDISSNYVKKIVFNGHTHKLNGGSGNKARALLSWDTYDTFVGDVSHIKSTVLISELRTNAPG